MERLQLGHAWATLAPEEAEMWVLLGTAALADPTLETTCDLLDPAEVAADTRWVRAADGIIDLVADGPPGMTWEARITVSLAQLTSSWTQEVAPDSNGRIVLRITPPETAFLHDAAADYLTGLRVHLYGTALRGTLPLSSPPAFLAWPNGPHGAPAVWDRATAEDLAPHGIVSATVRSALTGLDPGEMVEPALPLGTRNTEVE